MWEFFFAGIPSATCFIADNQKLNYQKITKDSLASPLGDLRDFNSNLSNKLNKFLSLETHIYEEMKDSGREMIDGMGRARIADEFENSILEI